MPEAWQIATTNTGCTVTAHDTEGIRRAIFYLEDEMLRTGGPFLRIGKIARQPVVRTRISRCFFGSINRPPKNRDELTDDVNYYPEEYLNRLAHEEVNGLWLTVSFKDLCPSRFFPDFGKDSERRLKKLRRTVQHCARYGIKIYVFCIEPRGFGENPEYLHPRKYLKDHPELAGHQVGEFTFFCTSTETGQAYLEEATQFLFSQVPGLGGLIDINLGERPTHCYSYMLWDSGPNRCARCSKREPWEVFRDTLEAMRRGMCQANPSAELISWLYVPHVLESRERKLQVFENEIRKVAKHFPSDVIFQYNYESMGRCMQLGRERVVRDYSLAYVGPSDIFSDCARLIRSHDGRVSAKLQVGCSHEVATVPCLPAPGNLFLKYKEMHRLGVSSAMQCWYFGNYPSLMTKAAGELSFSPFPESEAGFLKHLAGILWGRDARCVASAWTHFCNAYRQFPANLLFAWYGPVHDSVVWPLHLNPVDKPISPSWLLGFPPSGDRIGECIGYEHTLAEILTLCERMSGEWNKGVLLLEGLRKKYRGQSEQELEIGLATAIGLQLNSTLNVMTFYAKRESLYHEPTAPLRIRKARLVALRRLVLKEITNSQDLAKLAQTDSRLGFHSEAEGYKYFPARLLWRAGLLKKLLTTEFPKVERDLIEGNQLFPNYCGTKTTGKTYSCRGIRPSQRRQIPWDEIEEAICEGQEESGSSWKTGWKATHDRSRLYFKIECCTSARLRSGWNKSSDFFLGDFLTISIEPRRLWPVREYYIGAFGQQYDDITQVRLDSRWKVLVNRQHNRWEAVIEIPFACFGWDNNPFLRINVKRSIPKIGTMAWIPLHPVPNRLIFGAHNPEDLGWLKLK